MACPSADFSSQNCNENHFPQLFFLAMVFYAYKLVCAKRMFDICIYCT